MAVNSHLDEQPRDCATATIGRSMITDVLPLLLFSDYGAAAGATGSARAADAG